MLFSGDTKAKKMWLLPSRHMELLQYGHLQGNLGRLWGNDSVFLVCGKEMDLPSLNQTWTILAAVQRGGVMQSIHNLKNPSSSKVLSVSEAVCSSIASTSQVKIRMERDWGGWVNMKKVIYSLREGKRKGCGRQKRKLLHPSKTPCVRLFASSLYFSV